MEVSLPTIDTWIRAGCPYIRKGGRGREWEFNLADVANWREERARATALGDNDNIDEIKRKIWAVDLEAKTFDLAERKRLVAPVDEMTRMMSHVFAELRAGIMNLPARCTPLLTGETDARQIKKILTDEVEILLQKLSSEDLTDGYGGDDDDS
ncbi:terminase small subunit [Escherichia coli]|nr:terminase small subunit [Escherichia coli]